MVADSGEVRGDLRAWLRAWLRGFADFLAETENASLIRARTAADEAALTARLGGAVRLGRLRADTSTAAVLRPTRQHSCPPVPLVSGPRMDAGPAGSR